MAANKKIIVILFAIVLLPALFYSVYELSTLSETEELISQMYQRQLDAVLFSVNQYVLDIASSWATQTENDASQGEYRRLLLSNSSIVALLTSDSAFTRWNSYPVRRPEFLQAVREQKGVIDRLIRYQTVSYRKLEALPLTDSTFLIVFVPSTSIIDARIIGIIVNNERFINDVVGKKLIDVAQYDFVFSVVSLSRKTTVFSTDAGSDTAFSHQRPLWIFPDHAVTIRLRGTTIQEAADNRFTTSMILLVLLDLVIIVGALFVYRLINREMELVAMKSDFVSNVSHELRTPLALIRMFAETLEMKRVRTERKKMEYYSIILNETERLTRLINNILNFSRMESNTRTYHFRPVELNELIASVLKIYSYRFEQLGFTVETSFDKSLPTILADEEAVAEALHNLIDNAVKYSGERKRIRITTAAAEASMRISVEDHGIGIAQEHHKKIFEKFYRVSQGLVHTAKGSGLGLALVHHIVQAHHGTITIHSEPGKGSTFTISLPLTQTS